MKFLAPYGPALTKISKYFFIFFWKITKIFITFYSLMTTLFIKMFGSDRIKIVGGVAFEIFAPIVSHVNENEKKNHKYLKIENFEKE